MAPYDFTRQMTSAPSLEALPRFCPTCSSKSIVSTEKAPRADSYWRCEQCGEVWSPSRRTTTPRSRWG